MKPNTIKQKRVMNKSDFHIQICFKTNEQREEMRNVKIFQTFKFFAINDSFIQLNQASFFERFSLFEILVSLQFHFHKYVCYVRPYMCVYGLVNGTDRQKNHQQLLSHSRTQSSKRKIRTNIKNNISCVRQCTNTHQS